jgi:hypothetical protein
MVKVSYRNGLMKAAAANSLFRLGDLVPQHSTDCSASAGAKHPTAAQHVTGDATNHGTGGGAFFLRGHSGTAAQEESGNHQYGAQLGKHGGSLIHGENS